MNSSFSLKDSSDLSIDSKLLFDMRQFNANTQNKAYSQLVDPKINIDQKNHDFEKEKIPNINDEIVDEHQQRLPIHLQNDLQTQITPAIKVEENKNMDLENSFLQDVKLRLDSDAIEKSYSKKFKSEKNSSSGLIVKDEYKGKTKLERNRKSARECRNRKKTYIKNLEIQVCCLQEELAKCKKELNDYKSKENEKFLNEIRIPEEELNFVSDKKESSKKLLDKYLVFRYITVEISRRRCY